MKKKGFTLIELLVVIAIIGLLATLAVVALNSARSKARDSRRVSDLKNISTALELYYNDQSSYPVVATGTTLGVSGSTNTLSSDNGFEGTASGITYMNNVPSNPSPGGTDYIYASLQEDGASACTTGSCPKYSITFTLENPIPSLGSGTTCTMSQDGMICS